MKRKASEADFQLEKENEEELNSDISLDDLWQGDELGEIVGTSTGEGDRDVIPGGWEGTDDATSTAPSDLSQPPRPGRTQASIGNAFGGGFAHAAGGICDLSGSPVEESRDWEHDAILSDEGDLL
jgi:hypothetical protein